MSTVGLQPIGRPSDPSWGLPSAQGLSISKLAQAN